MTFSTPKRHAATSHGKATWYEYYAGFTPKFVEDALNHLALLSKVRVLDPWNGSGTTTQVADEHGLVGVGYDINPALVMVAKARLLSATVQPSHKSLCENIIKAASRVPITFRDPLEDWFYRESALHIRALESAIQKILIPPQPAYTSIAARANLRDVSSLAAFFYVALFRTVRELTEKFGTSNPTWTKVPLPVERVRPQASIINSLFRNHVASMAHAQWSGKSDALLSSHNHGPSSQSAIEVGNSTNLPEPAASVSAAVCSPPYCTRIDYAIATRVELAVLGFDNLRELRESMIGSAIIQATMPEPQELWGQTCLSFLENLKRHRSKASESYYLKNHIQYYASLYKSIAELDRLLAPNGHCVIVAQDSYYKDIHNDLSRIIEEMTRTRGWQLVDKRDFNSTRHMGRVNPKSTNYRSPVVAVESVLYFRKKFEDGLAALGDLNVDTGTLPIHV